MPTGQFLNVDLLGAAVLDGEVGQDAIDDKVRRILRTIIRLGLVDGPKTRDPRAVPA